MTPQQLKQIKKYLSLALSILASVFFAVMIFVRGSGLPDLEKSYDERSRKLDIMLRNEAQGSSLPMELEEMNELMAKLPARLMRVDAKAQNYQFFYNIERRSRASISSLMQQEAKPSDGVVRPKLKDFSAMDFELSFSGHLVSVMSFLKRLEMGEYFVRFKSVSFSADTSVAADGLNVVLNLESLAQKKE